MPRARAHISLQTKLASTLLALGHVPYEHAKLMTADQIISLYQFDHNALHAFDGSDEFWNLEPKLIAPHRAKSKRDKAITSKVARIEKTEVAHADARMIGAAQDRGEQVADRLYDRPRAWPANRKIAVRVNPWPRKGRKLQSRNNLRKERRHGRD